jgi:hypothetical protein
MQRHEKAEGVMIGGGFILGTLAVCIIVYCAIQASMN